MRSLKLVKGKSNIARCILCRKIMPKESKRIFIDIGQSYGQLCAKCIIKARNSLSEKEIKYYEKEIILDNI